MFISLSPSACGAADPTSPTHSSRDVRLDVGGFTALRHFSRDPSTECVFLPKHIVKCSKNFIRNRYTNIYIHCLFSRGNVDFGPVGAFHGVDPRERPHFSATDLLKFSRSFFFPETLHRFCLWLGRSWSSRDYLRFLPRKWIWVAGTAQCCRIGLRNLVHGEG